jgi:hypothetical protein
MTNGCVGSEFGSFPVKKAIEQNPSSGIYVISEVLQTSIGCVVSGDVVASDEPLFVGNLF